MNTTGSILQDGTCGRPFLGTILRCAARQSRYAVAKRDMLEREVPYGSWLHENGHCFSFDGELMRRFIERGSGEKWWWQKHASCCSAWTRT